MPPFIEQLNQNLFVKIQGWPVHGPWIDFVAITAAEYLIYAVPAILVWLWLRGNPEDRAALVGATLAALLALLFNQIISGFWFHSRPFAIHLGQLLIPHAADSSFPSDHAAFTGTIALGLLVFSNYQKIAISFLFLSFVVGWSRIFVGVHFPLDIAGGMLTAVAGTIIIFPLMPVIEAILVNKFCVPVYRRIFYRPISRGWCVR